MNLELKTRKKSKGKQGSNDFMPTDSYSMAILDARARKLSELNIKTDAPSVEHQNSFVQFSLGQSDSYGIDYDVIVEIIKSVKATPIPYVPNYIMGVINRRGLLLTVIRLSRFLQLEHSAGIENENSSSIIIVKHEKIMVGFLVEKLISNAMYHSSELDSVATINGSIPADFVKGLYQARTSILNIQTILNAITKEIKSS